MHMSSNYPFAMAAMVVMATAVAVAMAAALSVPAAADSIADHVVISEVEIANEEWVELYNPTDAAVNTSSWYWCYYDSVKDWNQTSKKRAFEGRAENLVIEPHTFYLMRIDGTVPNADWDSGYGFPANTLDNTSGSVAIFPWDPTVKTVEEAEAGRIDSVAWGAVSHVKEGSAAPAPGSGMSLQRRVSETITFDGLHGPGWDTENNTADFFLYTPDPRSSGYSPVPPIPELGPLILYITGLCTLAGYLLSARRRAR